MDVLKLGVVASMLMLFSCTVQAQQFNATRLNNAQPIMSKKQFERVGASVEEGANINGPSVIRIPDWVPLHKRAAPDAKYYMYFGHHKGRYIRLAWAEAVEGPWQLHNTGSDIVEGKRGVLDIGDDRRMELGNKLSIFKHIASPDVHVDTINKRFVMYFHAPASYADQKCAGQKTLVATSPWGLDFSASIDSYLLSSSYLRVFDYNGRQQGLAGAKHYSRPGGDGWRSEADGVNPCSNIWRSHRARFLDFSTIPGTDDQPAIQKNIKIRHLGLHLSGETLLVFFTMKGHSPERILATQVQLGDFCWACVEPNEKPTEVMRAEEIWEGSAVNPSPSKKGPQFNLENALRDPFLFADDGKLYLFYVGGGEQAIGLAELRQAKIDDAI